MAKEIFCFGSNESGIHGAGAAKVAMEKHGAKWGKSYGHHGDSFAIPTKDEDIGFMPKERVEGYVQGFLAYARGHRKLKFKVTAIGCGLAGYKHEDIAPMFRMAPSNCSFDSAWEPWLGKDHNYWNTF